MLLLQLLRGFVFERDLVPFSLFLKNTDNMAKLGERLTPLRLSLFVSAIYEQFGLSSFASAGMYGVVTLVAYLEQRADTVWLDANLPFMLPNWLDKQARTFQGSPIRYSTSMAELVFRDFPEVAKLVDKLAHQCGSQAVAQDYITGAYTGLELLHALEEDGFKGVPV